MRKNGRYRTKLYKQHLAQVKTKSIGEKRKEQSKFYKDLSLSSFRSNCNFLEIIKTYNMFK